MIDINALFKVSYGLYIVSAGSKERGNGYISNTVFQVSSSPALFATCCNKDNYTAGMISDSGHFAVSVLHRDADARIIGSFGYKSGSEADKLKDMKVEYGLSGVPIILDDAIAYLEFRVVNTVDVGTHLMFIGELLQARILDEGREPLTYLYYREHRRGLAPKNAPTYVDKSAAVKKEETPGDAVPGTGAGAKAARWKCAACGYVYEEAAEDTPFDELPGDWVCPVCGAETEDFYKL